MKDSVYQIKYREKGKPKSPVLEMQLVATSGETARVAFQVWSWRHCPPVEYTITSCKRLGILKKPRERTSWQRLDPSRKKSQIYVCPHCQEQCYAPSQGCDYRYCPRCGKEVLK